MRREEFCVEHVKGNPLFGGLINPSDKVTGEAWIFASVPEGAGYQHIVDTGQRHCREIAQKEAGIPASAMTSCRFPDKLVHLINADICDIGETLIQKGLEVAISAAKVEDRAAAQIAHPCQDLEAPDLTFRAFPSQRLYRAVGISSNPVPVKVDDGGSVNEVHGNTASNDDLPVTCRARSLFFASLRFSRCCWKSSKSVECDQKVFPLCSER
jgi:hypothetical protein